MKWYVKLRLIILSFLMVCLSGCMLEDIQSEIRLTEAKVNITDSVTIPDESDINWQSIILEDNWLESHPEQDGYAWYHLTFSLEQVPEELWAIYIPHVNMNAEIWLNGKLLGSGGKMEGYISRNWNQPQYFVIAKGLLHSNINTIDIRLVTLPNLGGVLSAVHLGLDSQLKSAYSFQNHWQVTSVIGSSVFIFVAFIVFLVLRLYCRDDRFFLYATYASFTWFLIGIRFLIVDIPISPDVFFRIEQVVMLWSVVTFILMLSIYIYQRILKVCVYLTALAVLISLSGFVITDTFIFVVMIQLACAIPALSANLILFIHAYRTRQWVDVYLGLGLFIGTGFGIHDSMGLVGTFDDTYYHMLQFAGILPMTALGWVVVQRYSQALKISNNYNEELAFKVEEKHHELKVSFDKLNKFEQDKTLSKERERIMRDMHDGIGGQLVSIITSLQEETGDVFKKVKEKVQLSLVDLRFVIDSLDPLINDLPTLLGMMRMRMEDELNSANMELEWAVTELPDIVDMSPQRSLHVMRIVQEAMTNSIKHSKSDKLKVATGVIDNKVFVDIIDYGEASKKISTNISRGIKNMQYRAEQLGAKLAISNESSGTSVRLLLVN